MKHLLTISPWSVDHLQISISKNSPEINNRVVRLRWPRWFCRQNTLANPNNNPIDARDPKLVILRARVSGFCCFWGFKKGPQKASRNTSRLQHGALCFLTKAFNIVVACVQTSPVPFAKFLNTFILVINGQNVFETFRSQKQKQSWRFEILINPRWRAFSASFGFVWTVGQTGKRKVEFQNFPDTRPVLYEAWAVFELLAA